MAQHSADLNKGCAILRKEARAAVAQIMPAEVNQAGRGAHLPPAKVQIALISRLAALVSENTCETHHAIAPHLHERGDRWIRQMHRAALRILADQHRNCFLLEVDVLPLEPQQFALPQAGCEAHDNRSMYPGGVRLRDRQHSRKLRVIEKPDALARLTEKQTRRPCFLLRD